MPTYEYECTRCGQKIEVFQRITEDPLTTCGVCGGPLRKVFHPAGIVFKGSGFYSTDHRSKPKPSTSGGSGSKEGSGASSSKEGSSASSSKEGSSSPGGASSTSEKSV